MADYFEEFVTGRPGVVLGTRPCEKCGESMPTMVGRAAGDDTPIPPKSCERGGHCVPVPLRLPAGSGEKEREPQS